MKNIKLTDVTNIEDAMIKGVKFGFDLGYRAALDGLRAFSKGADNPEARKYMNLAADTLEKMSPQAFKLYCGDIRIETKETH